MRNLIKMDLRRMFKTPLLFALLLGLGVMVGTFGFTGIMGAVTMLLNMLANVFNIPVLRTIASYTIAGTNSISVINSSMGGFLHLLVTVVVWLLGATVLGCVIMKKKDV